MQTLSHFLITAFVNQQVQQRRRMPLPIHTPALLLGAVLPDIPFTLLTMGYGLYYKWLGHTPTGESPMVYMHFTLFFEDPIWIISHNFLHSLIINGLLLAVGYWALRLGHRWGRPVFWLAFSIQAHTLIDIVTHHSDGPLLFFPLNWSYRFPAPISYWEAEYYGPVVILVETAINISISGYFLVRWLRQWRASAR